MIMIRTTLISLFWIWLSLSEQWSQKVKKVFFFFFFFFFLGGGDNLPSPAHCSRRLTKVFRTVSVCFVLIGFMFNSIKKSWKDSNVRTFLDTYHIWYLNFLDILQKEKEIVMTYNMHLTIAMEIIRTLELLFVAQIFWVMQLLTQMNAI